ncbi:ATP-dependent zinc metalloprotease FtsH [Trichococcus shcherbakoviae]|uniref:ATP-dependent zinc metalloprotease FtsH n=2 Tax=Trichococcus shcherbakoviae TaxID=2094020 RepID=A0A383TD77_9LACT|nr:ATP-dependent zinc metalloprotease FtsH [Trichococcus shcherbakoviae]TNV68543.1 ATP-dependent metallopeptidase FtsH/Yme1/Tma family protein [Trichococcus shcherbakoviae subsp. psychrophilus]SYZ78115.1 peptidase m41 ftsh extracellular [Trichococcus shcherbakoviae]
MADDKNKNNRKWNLNLNNENPDKRRTTAYYLLMALSVLMFLNYFVLPSYMNRSVEEVTYSTFLNQVSAGDVSEVKLEDTQITFVATDDAGDKQVYMTGLIDDPTLVTRLEEADVTFSKDIPTEASPILSILVSWVLPLLLFWGLGSLLGKQMAKRMGGGASGALSFGKSNAKVYVKAGDSKTFKDVAGQDEAKEALSEVVDYLHQPKKYQDIGAKNPKGILLVGPPGTGKTLLARAVAGEADVPFFSISGSEFVEMFVGRGAAKVRDLFKEANEKAPCIVFIDEIDTIGKKRDNGGYGGGNDEREQTLNQLLAEMDGFEANKGIILLAATNRPESLDAALLRPGRFDRRVPVELPDLAGREAILKVHATNYKMDPSINYNTIARATSGASGAELANIINEGGLRAVREGRNAVTQSDLEESVETVIAGYQRKNAVISPKEKEIVSYHEIGHALVAAKQTESAPVHKITIIPRTSGALGYTMQIEEGEKSLMTKQELFNKIVTLAGGRAAEEIVFGSITTGASNDIEQMTRMARAMITRYGMSDTFDMMQIETQTNKYLGGDTSMNVSAGMAEQVDREVLDIIKQAHEKAISILNENSEKLHELSHFLLVEETITGAEFMKILGE